MKSVSFILVIAVVTLLLTACAAPSVETSTHEVKISGFTQGLMKQDADEKWRVYLPSDTLKYTVNGKCTADGVQYSCMWYGIAFDFRATDSQSTLACTTKSTSPSEYADPTHTYGKNVSTWHWKLRLNGKSGHINDQFYVINEQNVETDTTRCSYMGEPVLTFRTTLLPPKK